MITVVNVTHKSTAYLEPQTTQQIVGVLEEQGFTAELLCSSVDKLEECLVDRPDVEGIVFYGLMNVRGVLDENQQRRDKLATFLRERGFQGFIAAGGHQATLDPEETLTRCPAIDYILLGEPDDVVVPLVRSILGGGDVTKVPGIAFRTAVGQFQRNPPQKARTVLLATPLTRPYLERLLQSHPPKLLAALLEATRGCYHPGCTFCTTPSFARAVGAAPFRLKPIPTVASEIAAIADRFDVTKFVFEDDSFCAPGPAGERRLVEFADWLETFSRQIEFSMILRADFVNSRSRPIYERLRDLGLRLVYFGVETFSAADLHFYNKGISLKQTLDGIDILCELGYSMDVSAQLRLKPGLLPFHPYTTLDRIEEQSAAWKRYSITPIKMLARVELYPGTPLYDRVRTDGLLAPETRAGFRFQDPLTDRFHSTCLEALKLFYRPRRRIREIEKTVYGLGLHPELIQRLSAARERIESTFHDMFDQCLVACQHGAEQGDCDQLLDHFRQRMQHTLADHVSETDTAERWEAVVSAAARLYEGVGYGLPPHPEPVYFRPCWFPVIH